MMMGAMPIEGQAGRAQKGCSPGGGRRSGCPDSDMSSETSLRGSYCGIVASGHLCQTVFRVWEDTDCWAVGGDASHSEKR